MKSRFKARRGLSAVLLPVVIALGLLMPASANAAPLTSAVPASVTTTDSHVQRGGPLPMFNQAYVSTRSAKNGIQFAVKTGGRGHQ